MRALERDPEWGNDRMFVAFDPETNEILAFSRSVGKTRNDEGLASKAAKLDKKYVIHEFPHIRVDNEENGEEG